MADVKRLFISAGEASGDMHAANFIRACRALAPGLEVAALGGGEMESAGARLLCDMLGRFAVMGVVDALKVVPAIRRLRNETLAYFDIWKPDAAVLVDYPGFNVNLALHLKKRGIPVYYYICPQVWAWAPWRIHKIAKRVDKALVVFPFEEEIYERAGIPVEYVGHPLGDVFAARGLDREFIEKELKAAGGEIVALLPGSRRQEIEAGFPVKARAARLMREGLPAERGLRFVVPVTSGEHADMVRGMAAEEGLECEVYAGKTHEVMSVAKFALATSGTATLELAHFGVPMVVLYRVGLLGLALKRVLVTTERIALVNIVAGRGIVPELVYARDRSKTIAEMALAVLRDPVRWEETRREVRQVGEAIEAPGASMRAARAVVGGRGEKV